MKIDQLKKSFLYPSQSPAFISVRRDTQCISPLNTNTNPQNQDILDAFTQVTPAAQVLFLELRKTLDRVYGLCTYERDRRKEQHSVTYKLFSRHIVALRKAGLILRINSDTERKLGLNTDHLNYIVNPHLIIATDQASAKNIWQNLLK
jgi:hypothetical protein